MADRIWRWQKNIIGYTCATTATNSDEIPFELIASGLIFVPSGQTVATLTFWCAPYNLIDEPGRGTTKYTYVALYDSTLTAVTRSVSASKCIPFPDECFGAGGVRITGDVAATLDLSLKG